MPQNRLIHEKSPYLLQHAHNPVDWYAWGPEAFERARTEQKPIFLSIGYSTCHWCHVMERESFENEDTAAILNREFVCIKVDREERPDVDRIYMAYVQSTTGGGGWPMSVWLTPSLEPFVGGTYFPPENRYGRAGFPMVLQRIAQAWRDEREQIVTATSKVMEQLKKSSEVAPSDTELIPAVLETAFFVWRRSFDSKLGGFGQAPKFPRPVALNFLLRYYARTRNEEALAMTLETLRAMARGGMNDQLGGGFHRYSVDEHWFVPHFEKMLYDQGQLIVSYLEAFQITRDPQYAEVARRTLDYVLRDLQDAAGGFYSAEDADSVIDPARPREKGEGAFYIWTQEEIERIVGDPAALWFCFRFGVKPDGNVDNDPHREFPGRNILFEAYSIAETAHHFDASEEIVAAALGEASAKLLAEREQRIRPHLDDKVLTSWNGLMISAFAKGGVILKEPRYTSVAQRAVDFTITQMFDPATGVLLRRYRQGDAAIPGFLDDYAFFVQALLDRYEAQFDTRDLDLAIRLTEKQTDLFEDKEHGAFFSSSEGDANLVLRMKEDYDGAEPSGNSIAVMNLLRLSRVTGRVDFQASADRTLRAFAARISGGAFGVPQMLAAYEFSLAPHQQIIVAGERGTPETQALLNVLHAHFRPHRILMLADNASRPILARFNSTIASMLPVDGKPAAYVCENFACQLPITDPATLAELLQ